ncbi:MAG: RelA/SpoT domain-containing protein [Nitrospirota bacterium]
MAQMHDIGGCRAVLLMKSIDDVDRLVAVYRAGKSKTPHNRSMWDEENNYIARPKPDGYRSVHLILRYRSDSPTLAPFNGQRIDIRIRSRLQHAWA